MSERIKIGLSSCLAGDEVRYNGQGCRDKLVMDRLSEYFDYEGGENDMDRFMSAVGTETMQEVAAQFREFTDDATFMVTESIE